MELTNKQEQGLKIAIQRYNDHEKYTVISGYATSYGKKLVAPEFFCNGLITEVVQ